MLLSGVLVGGQSLANRAQVVDAPLGQGHVVMFAIRPFWRWQTQGTFFLGFNAILNWNDLDAGRPAPARTEHRAVAVGQFGAQDFRGQSLVTVPSDCPRIDAAYPFRVAERNLTLDRLTQRVAVGARHGSR